MTQDDMKDYREFLDANPIPNGGIVRVHSEDDYASWNYAMMTSHLITSMPCADSMRSDTEDELVDAIN